VVFHEGVAVGHNMDVEPRLQPFVSVLEIVGKALRLGPIRGHQDNPKQYQDFTDSHGLIVSAKIGILGETVALGPKKRKRRTEMRLSPKNQIIKIKPYKLINIIVQESVFAADALA
jgi:hypothetical protein